MKYYWEICFCVSIHGFSRITKLLCPIYIYLLYIEIHVFICALCIRTHPCTKHLDNLKSFTPTAGHGEGSLLKWELEMLVAMLDL